MLFKENNEKKYVFSKEVYSNSDERVEKITIEQIEEFDGVEVKVGHSYLGYIGKVRIASAWCREI